MLKNLCTVNSALPNKGKTKGAVIHKFYKTQKTLRLGNFISKVLTPIVQSQGFVRAGILLEWESIVGKRFSAICQPEKVIFPLHQRREGKLVIRTPSAMAPELAFLEPKILEKINCYYGYQAISRLVIVQGPIKKKQEKIESKPPLSSAAVDFVQNQTAAIEDVFLQKALFSWGCEILRHD